MDIRQVGTRLNEIAGYRNKPVYVYCSHSQRSRRVSKMLSDSGFTNVNNINGGLTGIYLLPEKERACVEKMITTANTYQVLSPADVCSSIKKEGSNIFLLDVRPDSAWDRISSSAKLNATGYLKGTTHISLAHLQESLSALPKNKHLIITDTYGGDAAAAARLLVKQGFVKTGFLLEGMDRWLSSDPRSISCAASLYVSPVKWSVMSAAAFSRFYPANNRTILLDVRPDIQYENKDPLTYRNIGHLKHAVHIPFSELGSKAAMIGSDLSVPIVIYEFSGGNEAYAAADMLSAKGFRNVHVLAGGLFNLQWSAANVDGLGFLKDWVEGKDE